MRNVDKSMDYQPINQEAQVDTKVDGLGVVVASPAQAAIGARMAAARKALGLSQAKFCEQNGYSLRTYQKNEGGHNEAGITLGAAFSRAGINANWLLTGEGPMRLADLADATRGPDTLDRERMSLAIQTIEEGLTEARLMVKPEKKGRLLLAIYDYLEEEGVTKEKVYNIIRLAA